MMLEPLQSIIQAMNVDGLQPSIISGYRSFTKQTIAWEMWAEREPARVAIISARPGTSEHQLGTAVDFGSSELSVNLIGNYWTLAFFIHPNIQG